MIGIEKIMRFIPYMYTEYKEPLQSRQDWPNTKNTFDLDNTNIYFWKKLF